MRETTNQAATRHRINVATLYRRLERLKDRGELTLSADDYVAGRIFLDVTKWDDICAKTLPIGRPCKGGT